jgi:CheY-like chemotaxis protein
MNRPAASPAPCRVLLVDDNRDGLAARQSILKELNLEVTTADNPSTALDLLAKSEFHLLITDFKMPEMDGAELIQQARRIAPNIKIILISGFVEPLGLTEQSTGADEVIPKTCGEVVALTRAVSKLLNRPVRKQPYPSPAPSPRVGSRAKASNL